MPVKKYILCYLIVLFLFNQSAKSQFYNLPNDYSFSLLTERQLALKDSSIHTGLKPYVHFFSNKYVHLEDTHRIFRYIVDDPAMDAVFNKHLIRVEPKKEKFKLRLDPLLNFETGKDVSDSISRWLYSNTRGFIGSGYIGDKFYFETLFAENQSFFPNYIANTSKLTSVVPGQGRWKQFKTTGFDYAFTSGFISMQPLKKLNIQIGHGKQKIGHGYRSLLLSDNAFNYPYARFTQQWFKGKIQYTNIYAVLMNLTSAAKVVNPNSERLFQKKAASFQYLSVNITSFLNLGLFQGLIWQAGDTKNKQHLQWQYFNPVIYTNLLGYGLNNRNNLLTGADIKIKLSDKLNVYGQLMLDKLADNDSSSAAWGFQGGLNYFDVFGIKNFFFQVEYNSVKMGSYLNPSSAATDQSYSHYNQTLAYTPGNGQEFILIGDYKKKRFFINAKYNYQTITLSKGSYSYNNIVNAKVGYVINPAYNLNISLGMLYRTQNFSIFNALNNETNYIYLSFKTSLYNLYYDF